MSHHTDSTPNGTASAVPFARPSITEREEEAVLRVLRGGWLTTAGEAASFEREFAAYVGSRHAIALNSATAGLHLALEAAGIGPGKTVAVTTYTFTASAATIRHVGAEVRFLDIDPVSLNTSPTALERTIDSVDAIIVVHMGGYPCDMGRIGALCEARGIPMIEDAAHSLGSSLGNRSLGTFGLAGVYSFYANKPITTGEGGMLVTDDDALAERVRLLRLHGIDRDVWNRFTETGAGWRYAVVEPGFKYNMPDTAAAIGRVQLEREPQMRRARRDIAERYHSAFADREYLVLPPMGGSDVEHAWHLYPIRLREGCLTRDRDAFIRELNQRGIGTSVHYIPLHLMPYYRDRYAIAEDAFPEALRAYRSEISLPIYPDLREADRVISAVLAVGDAARVARTSGWEGTGT